MAKHNLLVRLILAVAAGIFISKALAVLAHFVLQAAGKFSAISDPMFETRHLIISLILHSLFAIIGACFTAMIANEQAKKAIFILGTKDAIFWMLGIAFLWNHSPPWFNISKAVLGPPLAWIGGELYAFLRSWKKTKDLNG